MTPASTPEAGDGQTSLTHRALSGMLWVAWGGAAMIALRLIVLVLLARLLAPLDFGVVSAALIVIGFFLTFSQLGVGPALVQRLELEPRHISAAFFGSVGLGVFVAVVVWLAAPAIAAFFRMDQLTPVVRALALMFPVDGIASVAENLLQRNLRFRLLANTGIVSYGLGYGVVGVVLAFLGYGVWALVWAQLAQTLVRAAIFLYASPPLLHPAPTWRAFRELMDYGVGQSAGRFAWFFANQADNLVVGRWLGAVALGLYSRAYQLMTVPTVLLGDVLDKVLFPTMSQVQHDARRLASAYLQGTALVAILTLPVGVVAAILAPDLVRVVFGKGWEGAIAPFQILALGMMFRTNHRMSDSLAAAAGRVYSRAWRQALYAGLVFFSAWVGHSWGVTGVAAGVLGALLVNYLLMAHLSLSVGQISWVSFAHAQLPAFVLALVLGAVTVAMVAVARHFELPPLVNLVVSSVAAMGAAALVIRLAPAFTLGEHGIRMGNTLRAYVLARLRPRPL